jgi:transketolase
MRNVFCQSLVAAANHADFVFLTGDLGYKALEPLQTALGSRFLNVGVAEQNMIGVSAGLARQGLRPWAYSIAPFAYARPFEQIRNDICAHRLPVVLVGNGGGYGYGVMGATHHALDDYGCLLGLCHMRAYLPAFDADVQFLVPKLMRLDHPAYLRLGLAEGPAGVSTPEFAPWRKLLPGSAGVLAVAGPIVGGLWSFALNLPEAERPAIWLVSELPLADPPPEFIADLACGRLLAVEEHVAQGGFGHMLAAWLLEHNVAPSSFGIVAAQGYPSGRYGSQKFHRKECGLDPASVFDRLSARPSPVPTPH